MLQTQSLVDLSVIVTCYNKSEFIDQIFPILEEMAEYGAEVVIVNDGSTDDSSKMLLSKCESSKYPIKLDKIENRGLAGAKDHGLTLATKDFIFFLDIDDTPNISNLIDFYSEYKNSGTQVGQANFTFSHTQLLGSVAIKTDQPLVFNTRSYRNELFDSRSWWRFLYRRDFLLLPENRFNKVFLTMKGKAFVLDDIFWMLHLSSIDIDIYQSAESTSIYNYYLPDHNQDLRWKSFLRQIQLLPEATKLYLLSLEQHQCIHDESFMFRTLFKVLWDHATLLSLSSYLKTSPSFFLAGSSIASSLPSHWSLINFFLLVFTPVRIIKYKVRSLKSH